MDITIKRKDIISILGLIEPFSERQNFRKILSNCLITIDSSVSENNVLFRASDSEISILVTSSLSVTESTKFCVNNKHLKDGLAKFRGEDIRIHGNEAQSLTFQSNDTKMRLPTIDPELFPPLDNEAETTNQFDIPAKVLKQCIDYTMFVVQPNDSRRNLSGVCLRIEENNQSRWISTDGHRLCQVNIALDNKEQTLKGTDCIIPHKALQRLHHLLPDDDTVVQVRFDINKLSIKIDNMTVSTRLIEGNFPNIDSVIPKDSQRDIEIDIASLRASLELVSTLTQDRVKAVKLSFSSDLLTLESEKEEEGDVQDSFPIAYQGEAFSIGFNATYMLDLLSVLKQHGTLTMHMKGALNPCLIDLPSDKQFLSVIMPLRIEW